MRQTNNSIQAGYPLNLDVLLQNNASGVGLNANGNIEEVSRPVTNGPRFSEQIVGSAGASRGETTRV